MSAREAILRRIRKTRGAPSARSERKAQIEARLADTPLGVIPAAGQLAGDAAVEQFCAKAFSVAASVDEITLPDEVRVRIAQYLNARQLPQHLRMGSDPRLAALPWNRVAGLDVAIGPAESTDLVGVSFAIAGIAETGTLLLRSGPDNPTTVNFLPEHHIVLIRADDIVGNMENAVARMRAGNNPMPRTVNLVTGPSRSADIEQTLLLGAHGPRALHIILLD